MMNVTPVVNAEPASASSAAPPLAPDVMVEKYVALRDKVGEIKKRHVEELAKYNLALSTLEALLLGVLNTQRAESLRTRAGTFFKSTRSSAKVMDWQQTLAFIREREAWDLLEARVSKLAVEAIIQETKHPIPGVEVTRETVVNVRRA